MQKRHKLFGSYPYISSSRLLIRKMEPGDAGDIERLTGEEEVYRFLPSFLYEKKYPDKGEVIIRSGKECFDTKDSILLSVVLKDEKKAVIGIAEIYNYEPEKEKASIGYRFLKEYWGKGYATETVEALKEYLFGKTDVRKITAHVMAENAASGSVLIKNGFEAKWKDLLEDWGFETPVRVDKYILKKRQ